MDGQVLVANDGLRTVHETVNGVPVTRVGALKKVGAVAICPTFPFWMRRLTCDVMVIHEPNPVALVHWLDGGSSRRERRQSANNECRSPAGTGGT